MMRKVEFGFVKVTTFILKIESVMKCFRRIVLLNL